jgi:hypothetical protein
MGQEEALHVQVGMCVHVHVVYPHFTCFIYHSQKKQP